MRVSAAVLCSLCAVPGNFAGAGEPPPAAAQAYSLPVPGLDAAQLERFANGRQEFHQRWVVMPSIGGKWGRGPTSNAEQCIDCHVNNGRGRAPDSRIEPLSSMVVRLSLPGEDEHGGPRPHPDYGDQLQTQGELGRVPAEGTAAIEWLDHDEALADGTVVTLRLPRLIVGHLAFGDLGRDILTSVRIAPPAFGAGLLDAVDEAQLAENASRQRALGFNGRLNYVWDAQKQARAVGKFGWKASQPGLGQQDASAFLNDMGVTTRVFMHDNCPGRQAACRKHPLGLVPEQQDRPFGELVFYTQALAAPAPRDPEDATVLRGERLFAEAQCAACHVPQMRTGDYPGLPALARQVIRPYTDLLLHDMGEGLADGRPDFLAGPRDWRTPPLWGLGLSRAVNGNAALLHDGRARNVTEAVLWHGGEAQRSRDAFRAMSAADRAALIAFVESI
ncbi:MAG TPA: di-heme oxidoredictase family protein [Burkholderiales bacterium]|nr:di-heme oxidoredictase family protein [Burkholderiales bacterium]